MNQAGKVALVTGGSRGIGRGICLALARQGYAVAINYAGNEAAARETARLIEQLAQAAMVVRADVGNSADRNRMVDEVLAAWGRIDVLVNNAGITSPGRRDILEAAEAAWDEVMAINLKGPFFLTQRVAQEMIRLQQAHGPPTEGLPTIVNISSLSSYAPATNRGDYCISKAGLHMMTQLWALRLADHGIRVFEVCPGVIETDMTAAAKEKYTPLIEAGLSPIRRWGTPDDVGQAVAALVTGAFPFSTGDVIHVDGGFHIRKFPVT